MFIYKITNVINNKIYIGQVYNKSVETRFKRHIADSINSKTAIGRAICKYGKDNFIVEQIDTASSLNELNEKEKYWIAYYNSTNRLIGYNLTLGGDGGNTYISKNEKEMELIKNKISNANFGRKNGMSKSIKALNVKTNEIIHFDTLAATCKYFNHKQKATFVKHCDHKAICLWKGEWTFAYENDEFYTNLQETYDRSLNKGVKVELINLKTKETKLFNSINKVIEYLKNIFSLQKLKLSFKDNICIFNNYKIIRN